MATTGTIDAPVLPEYGCMIEDGYTNTLRQKKTYLAMKHEKVDKDLIEAKYVITDNQNMEDFTQWWLVVLDYGSKPFEIPDALFMGYKGRVVVKMDNDLKVDYRAGGWEIPMQLNIMHFIDDKQMSATP